MTPTIRRDGRRLCLLWLITSCAAPRTTAPRPARPPEVVQADCGAPAPEHYEVTVVLEPARRRLRAGVKVEIRCLPKGGARFLLNRELAVDAAFVDGQVATAHELGAERPPNSEVARPVVVSHNLTAGGRATLEIAYSGRLGGAYGGVNELSDHLIELARASAWYPIFPGATTFTSQVRVLLPDRFRVVSRGVLVERLSAGGGRRSPSREELWRAEVPGTDLVLVASPRMRTLVQTGSHGTVTAYYLTLPSAKVRRLAQAALASMEILTAAFGEGPGRDELTLVFSPRGGAGYSRTGLIVVPEERARSSLSEVRGFSDRVHENAHEIARAWWSLADPKGGRPLVERGARRILGASCVVLAVRNVRARAPA